MKSLPILSEMTVPTSGNKDVIEWIRKTAEGAFPEKAKAYISMIPNTFEMAIRYCNEGHSLIFNY